jgi:flavin-dependent thymidylate synthase
MSGSSDVQKWADAAMYRSEPTPAEPSVVLLNATPDPLGSVAALCLQYKGVVVRDLETVTDHERRESLEAMQKTELRGPLEAATFHFLLDGVTRAMVDQLTRGRAAFYAVESLRFAVKEDWAATVPRPPSLAGLPEDDPRVVVWRGALNRTEDAYAALVGAGVPAEDARSLLPLGVATRAHWVVSLRELLHVAGLRLCTQAQFEWRIVMSKVVEALRTYGYEPAAWDEQPRPNRADAWQFEALAEVLRPVCYQQGKCGFMAAFDRSCSIRVRVEQNAEAGRPSSEWHQDAFRSSGNIAAIQPSEWLADPNAARS